MGKQKAEPTISSEAVTPGPTSEPESPPPDPAPPGASQPPPPPSHTIENFVELTAYVREFRKVSPACEKLAATVDRKDAAPSPDDVLAVELLPAALDALLPFMQDARVAALLDRFITGAKE